MAQPSVVVLMVAMTGTIGGLLYMHARREDSVSPQEPARTETRTTADAAPSSAESAPVPAIAGDAIVEPKQAPAQEIAANDVAQWIADTHSADAKTRADAIAALANAPKAQAIPALERVLESGEPQVDRQIALRSLHTLALNDGDANGKIRDAIRHAVYHSEDESVAQNAQALLEDIEAAFDERAQHAQ